jgi:nitroreductase
METQNLIEKIIEHARWAPSGDNMQTWRFEIINDHHFVVHGFDTRDHCVYDLNGHASQLALGALLESIAIAASEFLHRSEFKLRSDTPESKPTIDVFLTHTPEVKLDPLFACLALRSVQRRMMLAKPLDSTQKQALQESIGRFYSVIWMESFANRCQTAWLMARNAKLRLTLPEAFPTHSTVIEWNSRFSDDKIPDQAVGLDPIATRLMKWAMKSWARVDILNRYFFGTLLPRIELDLLPGFFCAAHFALVAEHEATSVEDYLQAGRAMQRFWLAAAKLGLQLQPEMTPLIFSTYVRKNLKFTEVPKLLVLANQLEKSLANLLGTENAKKTVFMGRIGQGQVAKSRSLRLSVKELTLNQNP